MDPVSLIVAALAAGAVQGVGSAAGTAVTDAYQALKGRVRELLSGREAGEVALQRHEAAPDVWREPLKAELAAVSADRDLDLIQAARVLLDLADQQGARAGKYTVDVSRGQGVQVGDHGTQHNEFGAPSTG